MSHEQLELELSQISKEGEFIRPIQSPQVNKFLSDMPRSEVRRPISETIVESILPVSGEQVLPFHGPPHPIAQILMSSSSRPASFEGPMLPIVKRPVLEKESRAFEQNIKSPSTERMVEFEKPFKYIKSSESAAEMKGPLPRPTGRNVLFIYTPNLDLYYIKESYKTASETVIQPQDQFTIIWSPDRPQELEENYPTQERTFVRSAQGDIEVTDTSVTEVTEAIPPLILKSAKDLQERSPFIYRFISDPEFKNNNFSVILNPHVPLKWSLQQEFQQQGKYDIILFPCLSEEDNDFNKDIQVFLLKNSPVPVALVRVPK